MEQWEKNYYISAIAGANNGSSLVVMSKGTPKYVFPRPPFAQGLRSQLILLFAVRFMDGFAWDVTDFLQAIFNLVTFRDFLHSTILQSE